MPIHPSLVLPVPSFGAVKDGVGMLQGEGSDYNQSCGYYKLDYRGVFVERNSVTGERLGNVRVYALHWTSNNKIVSKVFFKKEKGERKEKKKEIEVQSTPSKGEKKRGERRIGI